MQPKLSQTKWANPNPTHNIQAVTNQTSKPQPHPQHSKSFQALPGTREASFSLSDGFQSLQERRVGVVPGREEPIGEREAKVVPV